jgi:ribosomal protein S18 acetylase RimI-like enzyme
MPFTGKLGHEDCRSNVMSLSVETTGSIWLSQIHIRQLSRDDLLDLEWDGEYTHFRRLYREVYQSSVKGNAILWGVDLLSVGVIGQLFVQLKSARAELADGVERAYIYAFRVRPLFRGYGIGTRLLQAVEEDLRQRGYLWVTLNVGRQNEDARRFYERNGYLVVAPEPGRWSYLDDQNQRHEVHEPAWRMEKELHYSLKKS